MLLLFTTAEFLMTYLLTHLLVGGGWVITTAEQEPPSLIRVAEATTVLLSMVLLSLQTFLLNKLNNYER